MASLSAATTYTGITALILVALLVITWFLGGRPLNLNSPPPKGWRIIADETMSYAVDTPPGWEWLEKSNERKHDLFADTITSNPQFLAIGAPFAEPGASLELIAVAIESATDGPQSSHFFTIARDISGRAVTLEGIIVLLERRGDEIDVLASNLVDRPDGRRTSEISIEFRSGSPALRCVQQVVVGTQASYLLTACSQRDRYPVAADDLHTMISSFRILSDPTVAR